MKINKYEYDVLSKMAKNNDLFAIREILHHYFDSKSENKIISKDTYHLKKETIKNYLNILIENGDSEAMLVLGGLYYGGENEFVEQDYSKAIYWYNESSKNGPLNLFKNCNVDAINNLGYSYYYGNGNTQDFKQAFLYFSKAAYLNHPNAMYKIGDMYKNGYYVKKNNNAAFYWYKKSYRYMSEYSIDNKYITASIASRLGQAYLYGEGTEISLMKSLNYLQKAEKNFYSLAIKKPLISNSIFVEKPLKKVQEMLKNVHKQLNTLL